MGARSVAGILSILVIVAACGTAVISPMASPSGTGTALPTTVPGASGEPAFAPASVAFWDATHGIAVGARKPGDPASEGVVATTEDGGRTWQGRGTGGPPLSRVTVAGASDAWATTACTAPLPDGSCPGTTMHSSDRGVTWAPLATPVDLVSFVDPRHGWGARQGGFNQGGQGGRSAAQLGETLDGGATWRDAGLICGAGLPMLVGLRFVDDRTGWAECGGQVGVGTMGPNATYETADGARTWSVRSSVTFADPVVTVGTPPGGPVYGAFFLPSGHGWIWQGRSGTASTLDGGRTWTSGPPGVPEEVFIDSIWFVSDELGFALDEQMHLLGTSDGGAHWSSIHTWPPAN
jgi:photosystem II stability/assembly factor-like uncharacterized protein